MNFSGLTLIFWTPTHICQNRHHIQFVQYFIGTREVTIFKSILFFTSWPVIQYLRMRIYVVKIRKQECTDITKLYVAIFIDLNSFTYVCLLNHIQIFKLLILTIDMVLKSDSDWTNLTVFNSYNNSFWGCL